MNTSMKAIVAAAKAAQATTKPTEKTVMDTLTLTPLQFAEYMQVRGKEAQALGDKIKKEYGSVGWELRKALNTKRREIEGLHALQFIKALDAAGKDQTAVLDAYLNMKESLPMVADAIEGTYLQYEGHAQAVQGMTGWEFELHPFTRAITNIQSADAQEEMDWLLDDEFEDEWDDSTKEIYAQYGYAQEMERNGSKRYKEQSNFNEEKGKRGQATSGINVVYEDITREDWLQDRVERDFAEWKLIASSGAWTHACKVTENAIKQWPQLVEVLSESQQAKFAALGVSFKTIIPMMIRYRTKAIDAIVGINRMQNFVDYRRGLEDRNTNSFGFVPGQDEEMLRAELQLVEMVNTKEHLDMLNEILLDDERFMGLDAPLPAYSTWFQFNPLEAIREKLAESEYHLLANVHVDGVEMENAETKTTSVMYRFDVAKGISHANLVKLADIIGKVRYEFSLMRAAELEVLRQKELLEQMGKAAATAPSTSR